jgi:ribose-phosphate pyrophosphokinase
VVDKRRTSADSTKQENIIGAPVKGKVVLMFDDMISTGSSICGAAKVLKQNGARAIHVAATHGVLVGPAVERLTAAPIDSIAITDTIPLKPEQMLPKIKVLTVGPLLGQAIKRIHRNESVSMLFV